jgi:hypothetical protein
MPYLAAAAVMAAWVPAAQAQTTGSTPPTLSAPSSSLSDQKLDAAAAALGRVVSLQQSYRQRLAQANGADEQQRLITEANNELTKAVTDQGLSVEEYSSIMKQAQQDPDLRDKLVQRVDPAAKAPAGK